MKKAILTSILGCFTLIVFAQTDWSKYTDLKDIRASSTAELAVKLTEGLKTEQEKVEALYYWMTHNIAYDVKLFEKMVNKGPVRERVTSAEKQAKIDGYISYTMKKKKGVCQNYAYTFKALCEAIDIESAFIGGYSKSNFQRPSSLGRHAWNAVKIEGEWQLLDVTWGAGYVNNGKFTQRFEPGFFLTPPDLFRLNHLPMEEKWQLVTPTIDEETYKEGPFVGPGFFAYQLADFSPFAAKVEVKRSKGYTISFVAARPLENIRCYNITTGKPVSLEIKETDNRYKLTLGGKNLRSGSYIFKAGDKILFTQRIVAR